MARKQLAVMPKEKKKSMAAHEAMEEKIMGPKMHARVEAAEKKAMMGKKKTTPKKKTVKKGMKGY